MSTPTPVPGRVEVDAPPIEPYTYGLLSVAQVVTGDGRWQMGGVEYETDACAQGGRVEGSCPVPDPPTELTATVTATPSEGLGVRVERPSEEATTDLVLTADAGLTGPVTVTVTPPEDGGEPIDVELEPGESTPVETETEGGWTISYPAGSGCSATEVTIPYAEGSGDLGSCLTLAYPVVWSSGSSSETTVAYEVRRGSTVIDAGSVAPGGSRPAVVYAPGEYDVVFTAAGATSPESGSLVVPGGASPFSLSFEVPSGTTSHDKPLAEGLTWVESGGPFTVYARAECNAVAFPDPQERAMARLRLVEHREVERAFSLQLAAAGARTPLGTTAVPLAVALGALEQDAVLHYAGQPTLHAPRWTQPVWTTARLVARQGPEMRTELESRVAFGGGYYDDPAAPSDPAPAEGVFWLYATGTVTAHRSQPFVHEAFDPPTNTRTAIAERTYVLDHDCYAAAVLVSVAGGDA
ncbi:MULTISPECIES: hypothetical protein [Streptomycetaceae]|uniref:hypothetical protein n=1 Tax=Streptomycetaceae TaxID=2062 RepID=UPI0003776C7F|nr:MULTISPECIES: hypothetical protein [Streptomycetaceae]